MGDFLFYYMSKRFYIIAGEASGDLHGSALVRAIIKAEPQTYFRGFGGKSMKSVGVDISIDIEKLAVIGFREVLGNLKSLLSYFSRAKQEILEFKPDALILIDYPGFNLRLAKWANSKGIKVFYYIAPQVWAWAGYRTKAIRKYTDRLFVILPFEEDFFKSRNIDAEYVGNPVVEAIEAFMPDPEFSKRYDIPVEKIKIAFFPGSRMSELHKHLDTVVPVIKSNPDKIFLVAVKSGLQHKKLDLLAEMPNTRLIPDSNYDILHISDAGIIKSGTSTLEAALFDLPQVVIYRTSFISYHIFKALAAPIKYVSLVNLVLNKPAVEELLQNKLTPNYLSSALQNILDPAISQSIREDYSVCRSMLKKETYASELTARKILSSV